MNERAISRSYVKNLYISKQSGIFSLSNSKDDLVAFIASVSILTKECSSPRGCLEMYGFFLFLILNQHCKGQHCGQFRQKR